MATHPFIRIGQLLAVLGLVLSASLVASGQNTQPVWWPPTGLYGRPVSQPYFDFPPWARYTYCRPAPLTWGYDPFPNYGPGECAEPGVPSINCPGDFVAHRPNYVYGSADFAPTTFDYQTDVDFARVGTNGATVLSTSNLDPEFDAGGKYTLGARLLGCYRLEGTYWGAFHWRDAAAVQSSSGNVSTLLSDGFGNPAVPALDNNGFVGIVSSSEMHSSELNLLYWIDMPPGGLDVSLLVGGRHVVLREQLDFTSINAVQRNDVSIATDNDLWGVQVGLVSDWLLHPRFWVHFDIKGAIFDNQIDVNSAFTLGTVSDARLSAQSRTTWMGDMSLVANFQMTPWLVARLGYQALFVEGVALAAQNVETNNALLIGGPTEIDDRGSLVFHGPIIGLMGVW